MKGTGVRTSLTLRSIVGQWEWSHEGPRSVQSETGGSVKDRTDGEKSPEDERLAEQVLAKVEADLEAQNRVDSAKPVANQLGKLAKAADKENFKERAALLYAATSFVLLGLEDIAMHHLLPLLKMLQKGPPARHEN